MDITGKIFIQLSFIILFGVNIFSRTNVIVDIHGELKRWHKVKLTFTGPEADEQGEPNPFFDYRLRATFQNGNDKYLVPGYFTADGNAAESGAEKGNKWRVHFSPDQTGTWINTVSFRQGKEIAISNNPGAGSPIEKLDGLKGSFVIETSDNTGRDNRAKGRLEYVGKCYL